MLPNEVYVIESYGGEWEDKWQSAIEFCLYENEAIARVKELLEEETKLANFFNSNTNEQMDILRDKAFINLFNEFGLQTILTENGEIDWGSEEIEHTHRQNIESPEYWDRYHKIWNDYPEYYEPTFYRFKKVERSK